MKILSFLSVFSGIILCNAQLSDYYTQDDNFFKTAENHYFNEAYKGSAYDFNQELNFNSKISSHQEQLAKLYTTTASLLYNEPFAIEAFESYLAQYPESPINEQSNYAAGIYYAKNNEFKKAISYLKNVDANGFSDDRKDAFLFTLGYAYFQEENYSAAKSQLSKISDNEKFTDAKNYMLGHILYTEKKYDKAFELFKKIETNPEYSTLIQPYLVQIFYNNKDYDKAIEEGESLIHTNQFPELKPELSKIIGESYFQKKEYLKATSYLETYVKSIEKPSFSDYYQLGFIYYEQGDYGKAVENFNKITNEKSAIAQNAFFQLGNSYVKNNQKNEALTAYKSAFEMNFDKKVQENALYNYAKLSYDVGNPYEARPNAIQKFLTQYPKSSHQTEMQELLIHSFLLSKNYKGALESLQKMPSKNVDLQKTEQTVALFYGIEQFNKGDYAASILPFNTSLQYQHNPKFYAKALYWKGESFYHLNNYEEALKAYSTLEKANISIEESSQLNYQLGYCYLKLKKFDQAAIYFKKYTQSNPPAEYKADAQLRLADSYYGNQDLNQAISTYENIAESGEYEQDFATLQKAILLGLNGQNAQKIDALETFLKKYPSSKHTEEAYYELGSAYQYQENYLKSIVAFDKVIASKEDLKLFALSSIGKANNYASLGEDSRALSSYKDIAQEFKGTDYAAQAVLASKAIYIKQGKISDYEKFAKDNGISISNEESEELYFLNAQKAYFDKKYPEAISQLQNFLKTYKNSSRTTAANYFLGDSYYKSNQDDKALTYLNPIAKSQNEYQEDALFAISRIYLDQQNDTQAKLSLEALYQITQNPTYQNTAELELMYIYSEENNTEKAAEMAQKVLMNDKNSEATKEQANLILARNSFKNNQLTDAKTKFSALEKAKNNAVKAEALYYKALFKFQDKKYKESNDIIFDLNSKLTEQEYWTTKALVLMANNYYQLKDTYQATFLLDEVINNYSQYPDLVQEAKKLQATIKK